MNIFDCPQKYRRELLSTTWVEEQRDFSGRPLICVFFTSYCVVGCPFCFFHSPQVCRENNETQARENHFSPEGVDKFIRFANDSNVGYLQISGGGEPFLEFEAILKCVQFVHADRIILVTSGFWAKSRENADHYLRKLHAAWNNNSSKPRLTIRLSVSSYHSIRLKEAPLVNLIEAFEAQYCDTGRFTLQIKCFEDDNTLTDYLDQYFPGYQTTFLTSNGTDDDQIIKIMPWKYKLTLASGYEIIIGKSRIFHPTLYPDLGDTQMVEQNTAIYDIDLELSQNGYPSIVYNSDGTIGLDWIVEYNGNVCTWQNRVQDHLLNIYEDDYTTVKKAVLSDLISYSFIDKGSKYRESIIREISPRAVTLMKTVNIRDYASTLLFLDEKIRLYYNIRVLQDYLAANKISRDKLIALSNELLEAVTAPVQALQDAYHAASYSVLDQEYAVPRSEIEMYDFLCLVKHGHFELNAEQISKALKRFNTLSLKKKLDRLDDAIVSPDQSVAFERRLTKRMMTRKIIAGENRTRTIIICRHGETNWNIAGRIKGQIDGLETVFTPVGMQQIQSLTDYLAEKSIEAIFTSDLYRAVETARQINDSLALPLYFCEKFRGLNMGIYQGGMMRDFLKDDRVCHAFRDYDFVIPGGESIHQLIARFLCGLSLACETECYQTVAVISHGAAISNIRSYLAGTPYEDIDFCVLHVSHGNYNVIEAGRYTDAVPKRS